MQQDRKVLVFALERPTKSNIGVENFSHVPESTSASVNIRENIDKCVLVLTSPSLYLNVKNHVVFN
jgi:hypothetical protein